MKYIYKKDLGSVYWIEDNSLMFAPILKDGQFDTKEGGQVDYELIKGEKDKNGKLFTRIYLEIVEKLQV